MLHSEPEQSWMQPVLGEVTELGFEGAAAHLRQWVRVTLPTLNLARHDDIKATMDVMRFEDAWAGTVLHDEHAEWQAEVHLGPTREHYADRMSERRDRKAGLRVKPRWATIMRPSRSMRHLIGKADAKLLSETRMGSKRSLTAHTYPHRHAIGTACPACGQEDDAASPMLQYAHRHAPPDMTIGAEQSQQGAHGQLPPLSSSGALARRPPAQQQHNGTDSSTSDDEPQTHTRTAAKSPCHHCEA